MAKGHPPFFMHGPIRTMKHLIFQLLNWFCLVLLFIGIPAISSLKLGSIQISSRPVWHMLLLWGLALAWLGNAAWWYRSRSRNDRRASQGWLIGYTILGICFLGYTEGWIGFGWLKSWLLALKRSMG